MIRILALLPMLFTAPALSAAEISVTASVDRSQVALNDPFKFVVSVIGADGNVANPAIAQVAGLVFQAVGRSHNVSIIDGQMTSSVSFNYSVTPKVLGRITIPPVSVKIGDKTYESGPVQVEISPGPPPAASEQIPDVFVSAEVDNRKPFVGQQITYIFRMYTRTQLLSQPNLSPPDFTGLITEKLPVRQFNSTHNGAAYRVSEVRYALFPTAPGRLEIEPAVLSAQVPDTQDRGAFSRFFQTGRRLTLSTDLLELRVRPLPAEEKPAGFGGTVGSYRIESSVDRSSVKAGEPFTLSVIVSGRGLVKSIPEPDWPEIPGAKRYETVSTVETDVSGKLIGGQKTFKTIFIPQSSGRLRVPPVCLAAFNPATGKYYLLRSSLLEIKVEQPAAALLATRGDQKTADRLRQLQKDIRFLKTEFQPLTAVAWTLEKGFFARQIPPILFLLSGLFVHLLRRRARSDPRGARARSAIRNARRRLKDASRRVRRGESLAVHIALQEALSNYLADIWGISAAGLTLNEACARMAEDGADDETIRRFRELWEQADLIRYAPAAALDADLGRPVRETLDLLRRLERHR